MCPFSLKQISNFAMQLQDSFLHFEYGTDSASGSLHWELRFSKLELSYSLLACAASNKINTWGLHAQCRYSHAPPPHTHYKP